MANMQTEKTPDNVRTPKERVCDFNEVSLGYGEEEAVNEATRCLNCKNSPCKKGCPVNIDIPEFIKKISERDFLGAYDIISQKSSLSGICGRVCPQENQCEKECVRGIKNQPVSIGRLERFAADYARKKGYKKSLSTEKNGIKIAVVGSGPSGLSCAAELNNKGYEVTVFEALHELGGVLIYGIPEFRLPKDIVKAEIDSLKEDGVKFATDTVIGKTLTVKELFDSGFKAVYVASGAGLPKFMGIEGENLGGVYSANEFLTRINLMKAYCDDAKTPILRGRKVVVVGGGNVAMDSVRCAKRLGAEAYIVYRRSMAELPARLEEVHHALEEGIEFLTLTNPVRINADENFKVKSVTVTDMILGEADERGRKRPIVKPNSEHDIECDTVIMALGTTPNPLIKNTTEGLEVNSYGGIITDEYGQTNLNGVFAGGDAVTGSATVILAMGAGKKAAEGIDEFIRKQVNN